MAFRAGRNPFRDRPVVKGRPSFVIMSSVIETIERAQLRRVPSFAPGDRVKVHFQVIEGSRRRVQVFEGVVIKRQGHGARETFTVRKQSFGVGVERSFPVHSPKIERIELAARGDVRRAKLYYLRDRVGKRARVRERRYTGPEEAVEPGLLHEATEATDADGLTARETIIEDAEQPQPSVAEAAEGQPSPDSSAEGGSAGEGEPQPAGGAAPADGATDAEEPAEVAAAEAAPPPVQDTTSAGEERSDAVTDDGPDGDAEHSPASDADMAASSDAGGAQGGVPAGDQPA